jgi:hypothetical protein
MNQFLVSSDEERRINEILDRGIHEFNNNSILRSSIIQNESNSKENYDSVEITNRRDLMRTSDDNNYNLNLNYNYSNYPPSTNISKNNNSSLTELPKTGVKSSALKQLLDEMKSKNNLYTCTSEDDSDYRNYRRPNMQNTQNMKKFASPQKYSQSPNNKKEQPKELIFQDVKYDIKSLQDKINGLEKKLFNEDDKKNNGLNNKYCDKRSNKFLKEKSNSTKSLSKSKSVSVTYSHKSNSKMSSSFISASKRDSSFTTIKGDFETKYHQLKIDFDITKSNLVKERQKVITLEKKNERNRKKCEQYDELHDKNQLLNDKYKNLLSKFDESELIRKEQSKLIKSLQREIDLLRGSYHEETFGNVNKAEEFKEIRKEINEDREAILLSKKPIIKKKRKVKKSVSVSKSKK